MPSRRSRACSSEANRQVSRREPSPSGGSSRCQGLWPEGGGQGGNEIAAHPQQHLVAGAHLTLPGAPRSPEDRQVEICRTLEEINQQTGIQQLGYPVDTQPALPGAHQVPLAGFRGQGVRLHHTLPPSTDQRRRRSCRQRSCHTAWWTVCR